MPTVLLALFTLFLSPQIIGVRHRQVMISAPAGHSDSFTGADNTTLAGHDSNWSNLSTTFTVANSKVVSNTAQITGNWVSGGGRYTTSTSDISEAVFKGVTSGFENQKYVCVRANGTNYGYCLTAPLWKGTVTAIHVYKLGASIGNIGSQSINAGIDHTLRIVASGSSPVTLTLYVDGASIGTIQDSTSPIASGNPGFGAYSDTAGQSGIDSWKDF